jgi:hypothetical protein
MKIKVENILLELLSEEDLLALNERVVARLKHLRNVRAQVASIKLSVGSLVSFPNKQGITTTGKIIKINRVRCKIKVDNTTWNVPMSMIKLIA